MTDSVLTARSASAGHRDTPLGSGLVVTDRDGLGIATLSVRRGQRALLQQRLAEGLGLTLPEGPRRVTAGDTAVAGTGPGSWLVTRGQAGNALHPQLLSAVGDAASVTDQSDAYAVLRLGGAALRETLAKLVPIDLHTRAFRVGDVAATVLAHMGVLLWRLEDVDGQAVVEIAVYRSFAASLWHELASHSL